jgi:hypothetical protein
MEHYLPNGRRVVTGKEAAALKGVNEDAMRQTIKRLKDAGRLSMIPEEDWIDGRTPVYYPEDLGLES